MTQSATEASTSTNSPTKQRTALLANPAELKAQWEALLASHAHLHPPEAAKMLGVPETALVACRIGTGSTRLKPELASILAPIGQWGRVLCAFSNDAGVHMPLGEVEASLVDGTVRLKGALMEAHIDAASVADAYVFIDSDDSHGNTKSVQFFNAAGGAILKVFVFHKTHFRQAQEHFATLAHPDQRLTVAPQTTGSSETDPKVSAHEQEPTEALTDDQTRAEIAALLAKPGLATIELIGPSAQVKWSGQIGGARMDKAMFHIHETDLRSHLRYGPITGLKRSNSGTLILSGEAGELLRISTGGQA